MAEENKTTAGTQDGSNAGTPPVQQPSSAVETASQPTKGNDLVHGASKVDKEDAVYDKLMNAALERTAGADTSPSPAIPKTEAEPAQPEAVAGDPYSNLEPASRQALQRTGRLLPNEAWQAMKPIDKANWVKESKAMLAQREREYQQSRQQNQPAVGQQQESHVASSVRVDDLAPVYEEIEREMGPDARNAIQKLLDHRSGALETQLRSLAEQNAFLLNRLTEAEESEARKQIESELEGIEEAKNPEVLSQVNSKANALFQAEWANGNRKYTWKQALIDAHRTHFYPNIQQATQKKLSEKKQESLRGTPDRGTSAVKPARALKQDDREDWILDQLIEGKSRDQIAAALR